MATPHDSLFCQVFSDPHHAEGELRALLPDEIEREVAWDTLERLPATYKDVAHGDQHADLLFGVQIAGQPTLLYLLLEHKSTSDRFTALQLLGYVWRILDQFANDNPRARELPLIVAHHSCRGWQRGTELRDVFRAASTAQDTGALLSAVLSYLGKVRDISRDELRGIIRVELGPDLEDVMTSTYDQVLNEGRQQGLAQGKAQGKAEGVAEGKAEALLRMLDKRFGEPPAEVVARVESADVEDLDRWLLNLLDASSLDEVFADA